jgi:hypothetical protein
MIITWYTVVMNKYIKSQHQLFNQKCGTSLSSKKVSYLITFYYVSK